MGVNIYTGLEAACPGNRLSRDGVPCQYSAEGVMRLYLDFYDCGFN